MPALPMTVAQAAEAWAMTRQRVHALLKVPGLVDARKQGSTWLIYQSERPEPRRPGRPAQPRDQG